VATGEERLPFDRPPDVGSQVLFLADGKSLLTMNGHTGASRDGGVACVWDATTGKELRHFLCYQHRGYVVASADGGVVAVSDYLGDKAVRLRRVSTGKELWKPPGKHSWEVALSADGKKLVTTGHDDHVLHLWDVTTGKELQRFEGHRTPVMRIALAPDGKALASASIGVVGGDNTLRVWDVATGKERWTWSIPPSRVLTFTFSPDGRLLVTVGRPPPRLPADPNVVGEVRLWDVATDKEIRRWEGHAQQAIAAAFSPVLTASFSPDGRTLATGGGDHSVRLWEVATGKERRAFRGHEDAVLSVRFSPDGRRLASASYDGTVLVWDLTGRIGEDHSRARPLSADELEACWADLASGDAARAYRAILALAGSPDRGVAFLRGRLRPVEAADPRRVDRLLAALDGNDFAEREKAARQLEGLGFAAEPALRRALLGKPSLEVRRRVERILEKMEGGLMLRAGRGIEALELIGTAEARRLLQVLARGAPEARLTQEAKAALQRLAKRTADNR
jgi:hypothetical protein